MTKHEVTERICASGFYQEEEGCINYVRIMTDGVDKAYIEDDVFSLFCRNDGDKPMIADIPYELITQELLDFLLKA